MRLVRPSPALILLQKHAQLRYRWRKGTAIFYRYILCMCDYRRLQLFRLASTSFGLVNRQSSIVPVYLLCTHAIPVNRNWLSHTQTQRRKLTAAVALHNIADQEQTNIIVSVPSYHRHCDFITDSIPSVILIIMILIYSSDCFFRIYLIFNQIFVVVHVQLFLFFVRTVSKMKIKKQQNMRK